MTPTQPMDEQSEASTPRQRLAEAGAKMAGAIDAGECDPTVDELKALATSCDKARLPVEAARIRRWMAR